MSTIQSEILSGVATEVAFLTMWQLQPAPFKERAEVKFSF